MKCPKCEFDHPENREECLRCGVIFDKALSRASLSNHECAIGQDNEKKQFLFLERAKDFLLDIPPEENSLFHRGRTLLWILLAVWGIRFMFTPIRGEAFGESFMHLINLPFHEAGHIFFSPFGSFIGVLGGTLGQLLIPLIVAISFALRGDRFAVSVGLWWLGQSFMDCAPYIDDARAGQLPLLGGVTGSETEGYHDWENILSRLGMMQYDHIIARIFFGCGLVVMLTALLWGGYVLYISGKGHDRK